MKLRNKKTGEVVDTKDYGFRIAIPGDSFNGHGTYDIIEEYNSLAELNADWGDYASKEPRIKDEKKCKTFKAWVGTFANVSSTNLVFKYDAERYGFNNHVADSTIEFADCEGIDCEDRELYTVAELCGEEEE